MRTAAVILIALLPPVAVGQPKSAFDDVRRILTVHCDSCHSAQAKKVKGNLRIDQLSPDFDAKSREAWRTISKRIEAGEMPPESRPALSASEKQKLLDWIAAGVKAADVRRLAEGRAVLRRLNRVEYQNTLRDLLGISIDIVDTMPLDASAAGFDNVSEAQHVSTFLLERYLEAADKALSLAITNQPKPPPLIKKKHTLKETHGFKLSTEKVYRPQDDGTVIMFSSSNWNALSLTPFYPPDRGLYRFRITTSAVQSDGKPVVYRVDAGPMLMATKNHLVSYFDAPAGEPGVAEFVDDLEARSTIRIHPYGLANAQTVNKIGADDYKGPGLAVHHIEVEGPLHETWPPASHVRIFGDLPQAPVKNNRVEVTSKNPEADAERILTQFARRAFRRNVTAADVAPYLKLVNKRLADKSSFEQAVRVGLAGMLVSKDFLFLREPSGTLDDFALASRLSYFLWSTMPDDELLGLAEKKQLGEPKTLRAQVERMLKDKKSAQFTENFVSQWLNLREIDATSPSGLYPEYDEMLKESMLKETYLFFEEVLKNDLGTANFIDSDFAMLNGRMAKHYGIPGVEGWSFKKTPLPKDCHRGGVLTMASVLKVTANGTYTSPILRGAFVLDRLLGTPSPQPPDGVPAIEPDIRGATTIRQQLAKHRQSATCASCHAKIDPPGFALESFDVIGGYREYYRNSGNGKTVIIDGKRMNYLHGLAVDAADVLPDGRKFQNIDEYKKLLLADREQVTRNLASRLVTYATGAAVQPGDHAAVEAIVQRVHPNDGLRTLVHEIVQSDLFRKK